MRILQKAVESALGKIPDEMLFRAVLAKLEEAGHTLDNPDQEKLRSYLKKSNKGTFTLDSGPSSGASSGVLTLSFSDEEVAGILKKTEALIEDVIASTVPRLTGEIAQKTLDDLKNKWSKESRLQRRDMGGFRRRLRQRWGPAIESLR